VFLSWSGSGLWSSDGTDAGTSRLASLDAPCSYGQPGPWDRWSTASGSLAYFSCGSRALWVTDGSVTGTRKLLEMPARTEGNVWGSTPLDGGVAFGVSDVDGDELWFSDGSPAGTRPLGVRDLYPVGSVRSRVLLSNNWGEGLWTVDAAGHLEVLRADAYGQAFPWRGEAVFPLDAAGPPRLFATDGTQEGTRELEMGDLGPRIAYLNPIGTVGTDLLVLAGLGAGGQLLIASDGSPAGTRVLWAFGEGIGIGPTTAVGKLSFLRVESWPEGGAIWRTDGTQEGTEPVIEAPGFSCCAAMVAFGSKLLFERQTWPDRSEVWQTDGTREGSRPVPGLSSARLFDHAIVGDRLFLESQDLAHGAELWVVEDRSVNPLDE
jgi:ELWxxDGT repeat protein